MKGLVLRSFVDGMYGSKGMNEIIDIPPNVDWVKAGFVEVIEEEIETAAIEPPRKAIKKTARKRKPRTRKADA